MNKMLNKVVFTIVLIMLAACSSEQYDCHIITKYYDWTLVKVCDAPCNEWKLVESSIKERIENKHEIVSGKELKEFVESKYDSINYINTADKYFTDKTGKLPAEIIKLDCKKL